MSPATPTPATPSRRKSSRTWAGVDVGGARKGFDLAVVDERRLLELVPRLRSPQEVRRALEPHRPGLVAIDSPRSAAEPGQTLRECERELRDAVCGIRWTPDQARLDEGGAYYEWIRQGLELYEELAGPGDWELIEVFPTASWTRWAGKREGTRTDWTRAALSRLPLRGLPARTSQDARDAIAAAITARQHALGQTECFGPIVVPKPGPPKLSA